MSWGNCIELSVGPSFVPGIGSTKKHSCKCLVRAADQSTNHFHGEWEGPWWGGWGTPAGQEGFLESLEDGGGGDTRVNLQSRGKSQAVPTPLKLLLLFLFAGSLPSAREHSFSPYESLPVLKEPAQPAAPSLPEAELQPSQN